MSGDVDWAGLVHPLDEELARLRCEQYVRETVHWLRVNLAEVVLREREPDRWADDGGRA